MSTRTQYDVADAFSSNQSSKVYSLRSARVSTRRGVIDKDEVLQILNRYRSEHGAPPLEWSESCASRAQLRASHQTDTTTDFGENLARSTDERWGASTTACIQALRHWQKEETRYDFNKPGLSTHTDRFTANVWRMTTHVGFGVGKALYKGKKMYYVVAYFFPRGNLPGEFGQNVLPKGSVFNGDRNLIRLASSTRTPNGSPPVFIRVDTVSTEIKELRSTNGRFFFSILENRNIVVCEGTRQLWESRSKSASDPPVGSPFRLILQKNGDLVAYDKKSRGFWSSGTAACGPSPYRLTMQDDGHCVLYDGNWVAHWATSVPRL